MKIYCGKCGGAYDDQFVVCPHCGNIREEQQESFAVEEIKPEPPKSKKKTPKWVKITAVVVAVVIVLTGVLWSTGTLSNIMPVQAGYVRVPSVIGKSREKAKEILTKKKLGLLIIGKMDTDDDMELGLVCEQSPGKGDKAKGNADVSVMLSNGPKMGYMPATVYYKVDTATANIEAQGLKAEVKYEYSDEVGKDGVISQSVETNTAIKQGETVTITVSKGSKKESEGTVKMKNLVGMDFETARKELLKDGIYLLVEDAKYDDNAPENQIIVQNDKEGAEIQKGENVFVTISLGKEKVRVPDLIYLEKAEAESKLKDLGFTVKTETGSDENTADGLVLEQSAPSGEMLEKGSEITITVNDRPTTATDGETASSPIDEYVRGISFLEKKTYDLFIEKDYTNWENKTSLVDKSSEGYLGYYVYDFDNDNEDELLLISHKFNQPSCLDLSASISGIEPLETETYICVEIFEVEDGNVVKKDEAILFYTGENVDGYSEMIVFNYKDTVQIGFGEYREGFWGTGHEKGFCALKYDGNRFVEVMKEYWGGSGDPDMYQNIFDRLDEVYGITEENIYQGRKSDAFDTSDWMYNNFDVIDNILSVSVKAFDGSSVSEYYNGQDDITFKLSWK